MKKAIAGVLLILLLAYFYWPDAAVSVHYQTETIGRGDISLKVNAIGTLQPRESVEIGAQVSGQITRIYVEPGDTVEKGQLLAEIDASVHEATVDAGRAALMSLQAQLAEQQANLQLVHWQYKRQQSLFSQQLTTEETLQQALAGKLAAEARIARLNAEISQRSSNLKADEAHLGYTRIYAPMTGTVISVTAKEGQTLNATYQTPTLMQLADLNKMTVWALVSEADISRLHAGIPVSFSTLGSDGRQWHSQIRQVLPSPLTEETGKAVQYTVLFDVDNEDGVLLPKMTTQVSFLAAEAQQVLTVPLKAVVVINTSQQLYRVRLLNRQNEPEERQLTLGLRDRLYAEVVAGLQAGEQVITAEQRVSQERGLFRW